MVHVMIIAGGPNLR